jgi:hypothetical protein
MKRHDTTKDRLVQNGRTKERLRKHRNHRRIINRLARLARRANRKA